MKTWTYAPACMRRKAVWTNKVYVSSAEYQAKARNIADTASILLTVNVKTQQLFLTPTTESTKKPSKLGQNLSLNAAAQASTYNLLGNDVLLQAFRL